MTTRDERFEAALARTSFILVLMGIAAGVALLSGVDPLPQPTFGVVGATLAAVAELANWLPARRAAAVDPAVTLRQE